MATVNKSDRKKMVSTQLAGGTLIWHRVDTGAEIGRLAVDELMEETQFNLVVYGARQITADVVSAVDGIDNKMAGMAKAIESLRAGVWPRRPAAVGSMEPAIAMIMVAQGCDRAGALAILGLPASDS